MSQYPELREPLLFYVLHRANAVIRDRSIASVFKAFFIDEAWVFLKNPSIQRYVVEALKTWRKHNAALILSTQSLDDLRRSDLLDVILESCATKIFLANPDMDRELYRRQFHLNETEIEILAGLVPKQQFLIKTPEPPKIVNLCVDRKSYWLYTNDPYDNRKRAEAFAAHGFEKGFESWRESRRDLLRHFSGSSNRAKLLVKFFCKEQAMMRQIVPFRKGSSERMTRLYSGEIPLDQVRAAFSGKLLGKMENEAAA